jgi:DNA adenine methylase
MATLTPFRYPGGKTKMLPILMEHIDKLMVKAEGFCDGFVGGGSVLLEVAKKYPNHILYANDKDYWVYSFWKVVAESNAKNLYELLELMRSQPTLEHFYKLREEQTTDLVRCAYKAIFFNRTTFSGILSSGPIGGKNQSSKYAVDCRYNYKKLREKILACHDLIAGRTAVSNLDIVKYNVLWGTQNPPISIALYLDPPYYNKGDILYPEKMTIGAHQDMAIALGARTNWVLSYDDAPEIRELYKDKQIIDLSARYCINGKKDNWEHKNELIILPPKEG